jgi:hypothetical protein
MHFLSIPTSFPVQSWDSSNVTTSKFYSADFHESFTFTVKSSITTRRHTSFLKALSDAYHRTHISLIDHVVSDTTYLKPHNSSYSLSHTSPSSASNTLNIRKVDITAPGLRSVLNALVSPPIHIKVVVPPTMLSSSPYVGRSSSPSYFPSSHKRPSASSIISHILPSTFHSSKSSSERLESFMSSWTRLVGDPILSKWIVVVLASV